MQCRIADTNPPALIDASPHGLAKRYRYCVAYRDGIADRIAHGLCDTDGFTHPHTDRDADQDSNRNSITDGDAIGGNEVGLSTRAVNAEVSEAFLFRVPHLAFGLKGLRG